MKFSGQVNIIYNGTPAGDAVTVEYGGGTLHGLGGADTFYATYSEVAFFGDDDNDSLSVENGKCYLDGGAGDDALYFGSSQGSAFGGAGNDRITLVNGNGDLHGDDGDDVLQVYAGDAFMEGGTGNDVLAMLGGHGQLFGGAGNDLLDAGLEYGLMAGGTGDDTYILSHPDSTCAEAANEGFDTIRTGLDVYWLQVSNIESLVGTSDAGQKLGGTINALALFGARGADTLISGAFNDWIDGGAGADLMVGGDGNDVYVVDAAGDIAAETATGGMDEIRTASSRYVMQLANIERLVGTSASGQWLEATIGAVTMIGGGGLDTLVSGAGQDALQGGAGADLMVGGDGDDIYIVDDAGDICAEARSGGVDEIRTSLGVYGVVVANIERLVGTSDTGQALATDLLSQTIIGAAGNDTLNAGRDDDTLIGGWGDDWLIGGEGHDRFSYLAPEGGGDRILDFRHGEDVIALTGAAFGGMAAGALDASRLASGAANLSVGQIVFMAGSGDVYWDSNGSAQGGLNWLARLDCIAGVSAGDFIVV